MKVKRPPHRLVCVSLYVADVEAMDAMVERLKAAGIARASRSAVVRAAFAQASEARIRETIREGKDRPT